MPPKSKSKRGGGRAPAHQNTFAFTHNPHSKLTAKILASPIRHVCRRCHDKLAWRKQYRKYKPRTQPGKCNACQRKHAVTAAYHTICEPCTRTSSKAQMLLQQWNTQGYNDGSGNDASNDTTRDVNDTIPLPEATTDTTEVAPPPTTHAVYTQVCAMCVKAPALQSSSKDDESRRGESSAVPSGFYEAATATATPSGGHSPQNTAATTAPTSRYQPTASSARRHHSNKQLSGYNPYGAAPPPPPSPSQYHGGGGTTAGTTLSHPYHSQTQLTASRKRPRDESSSRHHCDPCDLEFDSSTALEAHKNSHVKCSVCAFEGAPKVVKGHFQAVHGKFSGSGFKTVTVQIPGCPLQRFRICVGNRPEDVQKWIQERKKKFPRARPTTFAAAAVDHPSQQSTANEPNKGLSTLLQGYSSSEEETEEPDGEQQGAEVAVTRDDKPLAAAAALSSPSSTMATTTTTTSPNPCHSFVKYGRCRRGDACPYSHDPSLRTFSNNRNLTTTARHRGTVQNKKNLLSTLLETDADRETKFALQLIHYMVHTSFLQNHDGQK